MILWTDEDVGRSVPSALRLVGCTAQRVPLHTPDVDWLKQASRVGALVFSCNKEMLSVPAERDTIIREKLGVVFLASGQESRRRTLQLILNRWDRIEDLDAHESKPFVYFLYLSGRMRKVL